MEELKVGDIVFLKSDMANPLYMTVSSVQNNVIKCVYRSGDTFPVVVFTREVLKISKKNRSE